LAFSWTGKPWFLTEGKLPAVLIIPSSWGSQLDGEITSTPFCIRVPGRASGSSQSRVDDGGGSRCVSGKLIGSLGFSCRGVFIGEGAVSEVDQGGHTCRGRSQGLVRAALLCGRPVAPLCLLFGLLEASVNFCMFGFCFVQFREYFLCNFSETQKQQKTGNWHCGILLIG
jgi:hypothetical protein